MLFNKTSLILLGLTCFLTSFANIVPGDIFSLQGLLHRLDGSTGSHPSAVWVKRNKQVPHTYLMGLSEVGDSVNFTLTEKGELIDTTFGTYLTIHNGTGTFGEASAYETPSPLFKVDGVYFGWNDTWAFISCNYYDEVIGNYSVMTLDKNASAVCPDGTIGLYNGYDVIATKY